METELSTLLKEYGLDSHEIAVFLYLVGKKELTAYKIAKDTKIHRSTSYDVLGRLIAKGFVSKLELQGKNVYMANNLTKVVSSLKDKETILSALMPKLASFESRGETRIRLLEGVEGQKQFDYELFDLAKTGKLSYCYIIGNTYAKASSANIFIERLIREFRHSRFDKQIEYKGIWDVRFKKDKIIQQYALLGQNRFLENLPSEVGTVLCDGCVAFLFTAEQPYVIQIKNRQVAAEFKGYFSFFWKQAR